MTDRPRYPGDDSGRVYDRDSTTGMPRWVKVAGIIVAVVALMVVVVVLLTGGNGGGSGGGHGPARHGSGGSDHSGRIS